MTDIDHTLAALHYHRVKETLDNWLEWNGIDPYDPPDGELLEIIPVAELIFLNSLAPGSKG
jgi:hypothetical protein